MLYNDFSSWLHRQFPDFNVQKIAVDAGFSCPNRDGTLSLGGCSYCNNRAFTPSYCNSELTISEQIQLGKKFFNKKYTNMKYLVYFQSFTNTYGSIQDLQSKYEEALAEEDVVGIIIGTRPDCISTPLLDYLEALSHQTFLIVEYGIESTNDETLKRIHRGHDFSCARKAIEETASRGIITGGHVILGLPGENRDEILRQATIVSSLPLTILKIHQLQIIRGTKLAQEYAENPFPLFTADEFVGLLVDYIRLLRSDIVLDRFVSQSPPDMLIAPRWGLKPQEFNKLLDNALRKAGEFK